MMKKFILGAGGGGRTALSILERNNIDNIFFIDDNTEKTEVNECQVLSTIKNHNFKINSTNEYIISFGCCHMKERNRLYNELKDYVSFYNAIDKSCIIDRTVTIGNGNIICAHTIAYPNSIIGNNCFICVNTTIDHDVVLGNNVYCSPGVNIAGGAQIGNNVFLGTNCTILPNIKIDDNAFIGAGSMVNKNINQNEKIVGNPCRKI